MEFEVEGLQHAPSGGKRRKWFKRCKWFKRPKFGCLCFGAYPDDEKDTPRTTSTSSCNRRQGYQSNPLAETFSGNTPMQLRGPYSFREPAGPPMRPQDAHAERDPVAYARAQLMTRAAQPVAASRGSPARRAQACSSGIRARGRMPRNGIDSGSSSSEDDVGVCFADDSGWGHELQVEVHKAGGRVSISRKGAGPLGRVANPWSARRRRAATTTTSDEEDDDESPRASTEYLCLEEGLATLETIKMNLAGQAPAEAEGVAPEVVDVHLSDDARSDLRGGGEGGLRDDADSTKNPSSTPASHPQEDKWSMSGRNPLFCDNSLHHHFQGVSRAAASEQGESSSVSAERDASAASATLTPPPPPPESTKGWKGRPSRRNCTIPPQEKNSTEANRANGDNVGGAMAEGQAFTVEVVRGPSGNDASDSSGSSLSTADLDQEKQLQIGLKGMIAELRLGSGTELGLVVEGESLPAHGKDDDASSSSLSTSDFEEAKTRLYEQSCVEVVDHLNAQAAGKVAKKLVANNAKDQRVHSFKGKEAVVEEWSGCDLVDICIGSAGVWAGGGFAVEGGMAARDSSESSGSLSTTDLEEAKIAALRDVEREAAVREIVEAETKADAGCASSSRVASPNGDPREPINRAVRAGSPFMKHELGPFMKDELGLEAGVSAAPVQLSEGSVDAACRLEHVRGGEAEHAHALQGGAGGAVLDMELSRDAGGLDGVHLNDSATSLAASDVGEDADSGFLRGKHALDGIGAPDVKLPRASSQQGVSEQEKEHAPSVTVNEKVSPSDDLVPVGGEEHQVLAKVDETSDTVQTFSALPNQVDFEESTTHGTRGIAEVEVEGSGTAGNGEGDNEPRLEDLILSTQQGLERQPEPACDEQAHSENSARDSHGLLASGLGTTENVCGEQGASTHVGSSVLRHQPADPFCESPREQNNLSLKLCNEVSAGEALENSALESREEYAQEIIDVKDVQGSSGPHETEVTEESQITKLLPEDIKGTLNAANRSQSGVADFGTGESNNSLDNMGALELETVEISDADGPGEQSALGVLEEHGTASPKDAITSTLPETPPTIPKRRAAHTEDKGSALLLSSQSSTVGTSTAAASVGHIPTDMVSPPLSQKPETPARRKIFGGGSLGPKEVIGRVVENDPLTSKVHLLSSAVYQMKAEEYTASLAAGLRSNTRLTELNLVDCNLTDSGAEALGQALLYNSTLILLNLEKNNIKQQGATALAKGLAQNCSLRHLNLLHQKQNSFGDATLTAFVDMLQKNVTLLKISWRLDSRKSFELNRLITRNNEIDRRLKTNREFAELLPADLQINPPLLKPFFPDVA